MNIEEESKTSEKTFAFKAEVAKVLDIVINSLYTDRDIFIRELISNAADALEKMRHLSLTESRLEADDLPLEIRIELDKDAGTCIVTDTGVGMTRKELQEDLGRIAHSGAGEFLNNLAENLKKDVNLIGRFGVGFYSAFMVSKKIEVHTRSYRPGARGLIWTSTGVEGFTITSGTDIQRGTRVICHLKDDAMAFADPQRIKGIIRRYSNFVPFPILVNGEKINTIQAVWTKHKTDVDDKEYKEFYKFIAGTDVEPLDWLHFSTDAPLSLNALLYIPGENVERFGIGKIESHVSLYCKKILIQRNAAGILPVWLRFLHGIVDSEDIPLNISRETMQDSSLTRRINQALTSRFIKFLEERAEHEADRYRSFWNTFGPFIKEGIVTDYQHRNNLARLLRFETSKSQPGDLVSLDQYVNRMPENQKEIYYLVGTDRNGIENGPFIEVFKKRDIEVIYFFDPVDDLVMMHLGNYKDKKLISADAEKLDLPEEQKKSKEPAEKKDAEKLDKKSIRSLSDWIRSTLQDKITIARESERLVHSPLILVNPEGQPSSAMQQLLKVFQDKNLEPTKRALEFNPEHPVIRRLNDIRKTDPTFAETILLQLYDHAALAAGLSVETREMLDRVSQIMDRAMGL